MDSTLDRLRRLQQLKSQKKITEAVNIAPPTPRSRPIPPSETRQVAHEDAPQTLNSLVPGEVIETEFGEVYLASRHYAVDQLRGRSAAGELLAYTPAELATNHPNFHLHDHLSFFDAAFIDVETTGLGGGASIYPFMVGVGTFELGGQEFGARHADDHSANASVRFVVRQLFMRNPGEEPALLATLAKLLEGKTLTVTFNGRSFDLPLLRTRYFYNRRLLPDADMPPVLLEEGSHLDLLMPARRLWKRRLQSCRLINLETQVLGLVRTQEDVPGMLIPQFYVDYVRSVDEGQEDARAMRGVFYHNHEDIVSMVGSATELYRVANPGEEFHLPVGIDAIDLISIGVMYESQARWRAAEAAYRHALERLSEHNALNDCFARLGALFKRLERWQEAAELWERWLTTVAGVDTTPFVELAKYHEWRSGDLEQAEMWVQWALHSVQTSASRPQSILQRIELEHRLARLQRKRQYGTEAQR